MVYDLFTVLGGARMYSLGAVVEWRDVGGVISYWSAMSGLIMPDVLKYMGWEIVGKASCRASAPVLLGSSSSTMF